MNLSFLSALITAAVGTVLPTTVEAQKIQHENASGHRGLQSFTTCDSDNACDTVVARYTRNEALDVIETVLKSVVNQPGCLDQSRATRSLRGATCPTTASAWQDCAF